MKMFATAAAFSLVATAGSAATVTVSSFSAASYSAAQSTFGTSVVENFEGFGEGTVADGFATAVGEFATVGGVGSGGTVTNSGFTNDGTTLAVRDGNVFGRVSTTAALTGNQSDNLFLDSNDTHGIDWTASVGGTMFNKILLTIRDAAEFGARMHITVDRHTVSYAGTGNGDTRLVLIEFDQAVSSSNIRFANLNGANNLTNDGFSIDDIAISPVPLPASSLLLLAGLGGLLTLKRRRAAV